MTAPFSYAHSAHTDWEVAMGEVLARLERPATGNLGFLYLSDHYEGEIADILTRLREETGVAHWVGSVGIGVIATRTEYLDTPALAVMLGTFPEDGFRVFPESTEMDRAGGGPRLPDGEAPYFAVVHGDPRTPDLERLVARQADQTRSGFLVGGLTSSRGQGAQIADGVIHGGLSGVAFGTGVRVATRLTQGCSPIGPQHRITEASRNVIGTLDGRPALDVLNEEMGELLARDLRRAAGHIFAAMPVPGSDRADYLVRNLIGADTERRFLAIAKMVEPGEAIMFCRRDGASAQADLDRMLGELRQAVAGRTILGGVYFSCLGRGENLFGPGSAELNAIAAGLGEFPLVGFFANGEISHDRLYGYTGVLTLFLGE